LKSNFETERNQQSISENRTGKVAAARKFNKSFTGTTSGRKRRFKICATPDEARPAQPRQDQEMKRPNSHSSTIALFSAWSITLASSCFLFPPDSSDDTGEGQDQGNGNGNGTETTPPFNEDPNNNNPGNNPGTECKYCNTPRPKSMRLNLSAALALAVVTQEDGRRRTGKASAAGAGRIVNFQTDYAESNLSDDDDGSSGETGEGAQDEDTLLKLNAEGQLDPALEDAVPEGAEMLTDAELAQMRDPGPLPKISAIGFSPDGSVYVLYERPFLYRMPDPADGMGVDTWSAESPYTCQLFRSVATWDTQAHPDKPSVGDLECVTNQLEIPSWRANRVLQFDKDGNVYFPARSGDSWRELFYRYDPLTQTLTEKVNANICWHDAQVTPIGSIFYTGTSSSDGNCDGTSFFRYISSDNTLTEIARDWWDFKYLSERDPDEPTNERIIFYGPDPNYDGEWGWESACIYRYDPAIADEENRTERIASCVQNEWQWLWDGAQTKPASELTGAERLAIKERCDLDDTLFIGGEGVSDLSQANDGTIFVAGSFRMKLAGAFECSLQVDADHCDTADPTHDDASSCEAAGGNWISIRESCSDPAYMNQFDCESNGGVWTWGSGPQWYTDATGTSCLITDDESEEDTDSGIYYRDGWHVMHVDCRDSDGGNQLTESVQGIALLEHDDDDGSPLIKLVSDVDEEVESFWTVNNGEKTTFYYSTYERGHYSLNTAYLDESGEIVRAKILDDYEVYNIMVDPTDVDRILLDALHFATNTYVLGSLNPNLPSADEVEASIEFVEGYSGKIDTLMIFPSW
jgi:hypothetical protein